MAKDQELFCGASFRASRRDAQVIAVIFLRDAFHLQAAFLKGRGDYAAANVRGGFVEAGRFGHDEFLKGGKHLRQHRFECI